MHILIATQDEIQQMSIIDTLMRIQPLSLTDSLLYDLFPSNTVLPILLTHMTCAQTPRRRAALHRAAAAGDGCLDLQCSGDGVRQR